MIVFDSSALLAYLQSEPGADRVRRELEAGGVVLAVNWSEVAQKVRARGADWGLARGLLLSYGLTVEPVLEVDAEDAARLWRVGEGLSIADRLCLAFAARRELRVLSCDAAWAGKPQVELAR